MVEELDGFGGVGARECLHLRENIEELSGREGIEGSGDSIRAAQSGREIDTEGKRREGRDRCLLWGWWEWSRAMSITILRHHGERWRRDVLLLVVGWRSIVVLSRIVRVVDT